MDPCLQTSLIVINTNPVINPISTYTASVLPYVVQQNVYSEFGTLIYDTGYTSNGSGINQLLTTSGLWINDSGTNGPLLRSAIWTNIPTSATTHWQPLSTWIGFSQCFNISEEKTYYVGLAGDNGSMLKLNGQIIVKQDVGLLPDTNFKYWHIYPVSLNIGNNIFEFFGYNQFNFAGFGFELYDNTYDELTGATGVNDLNILYSTITETGSTFDVVLDSNLTQTSSGYSCSNNLIYEPCRSRCVSLSSVTVNTCSATTEIINGVISQYRNIVSNNIVSIGYGFKSYNGLISNQYSLIFTTNSKLSFPDIPLSDVIPPTITYSTVTFITDVVYVTTSGTFTPNVPDNETTSTITTTTSSNNNSTISFNPNLNNPPSLAYSTVSCLGDTDISFQTTLWPVLKGGSAFAAYYEDTATCTGIIRATTRCGSTIGIVCVDNIDGTIVGLTSSSNLYINQTYTGNRDPNGLVQNAYNNIVKGGRSWSKFGRVKRYHPDNLNNSSQNIGLGLVTVDSIYFDPSSSWEQIELSDGMTYYDFATTLELDNYLQPGLQVYSVGAGTWAKGEDDNKLFVISTNISILGYPHYNQTAYSQASYDDCFSIIKSASTVPSGFICDQAFNTDDLGSSVVAEINGVRKIIGVILVLSDPQFGVCQVDGQGIAVRIDKVSNLLNISPYLGQGVNFSDSNNPIIECEVGMSFDSCKVINNETYCQIGMCYPSVPTNTKYIISCLDGCGLVVNFLNENVINGKFYRLEFGDFWPLSTVGRCFQIISASTEMPYISIDIMGAAIGFPSVSGPYDTCVECYDPCTSYTVRFPQFLINQAINNSDPNNDNAIFVQYSDCSTSLTVKKYTVPGTYPNDICNRQNAINPTMYYYNNNIIIYVQGYYDVNNNLIIVLLNTGASCQ